MFLVKIEETELNTTLFFVLLIISLLKVHLEQMRTIALESVIVLSYSK